MEARSAVVRQKGRAAKGSKAAERASLAKYDRTGRFLKWQASLFGRALNAGKLVEARRILTAMEEGIARKRAAKQRVRLKVGVPPIKTSRVAAHVPTLRTPIGRAETDAFRNLLGGAASAIILPPSKVRRLRVRARKLSGG
ncbi:hypothetical protein HY546_01650 [archaeon]|nr:hypothetical protein [archaeon]